MAVKRNKGNSELNALIAEAKKEGIEIDFDKEEKVYFGVVPGTENEEEPIEFADEDPVVLIDELRACGYMQANADEGFDYDTDEDDKPVVKVTTETTEKVFTEDTFKAALAKAKEWLEKAKTPKPVSRTRTRAKAVPADPTPPSAEAEVLPPEKPVANGSDTRRVADSDVCRLLIDYLRLTADNANAIADKLASSGELLPFVGANFSEDDAPEPRSRIRR